MEPRVLLARIRAVLRRYDPAPPDEPEKPQEPEILQFDALCINCAAQTITLDGESVQLTTHEFSLLWELAFHAGQPLDRDTLFQKTRGIPYNGFDRSCTTIPFLALITAVWIIPYWRKLHRISSAAIAFGNGNLDVRAMISKRSFLIPMADAFNTMADHIQQLIRSHKELTGTISQKLGPTINHIQINLEMLESASTPEKRHQYGCDLKAGLNELESLVSGLLELARLDREKPDLRFSDEDLGSWLPQAISALVPYDSPIDCELSMSLAPAGHRARFEPRYLARVLDNLIQNAFRYTCRQIHIIVEQQEEICCIHIDDDGPGVHEKDRERIFQPFTRLDTGIIRGSGGYGLGLAIVSSIAALHNGTVNVEQSPLGGARFTFRWPAYGRNSHQQFNYQSSSCSNH